MQIGAVYPQTEMETDPVAVAHFGQAAEEMGFRFIDAYDHVLGANRESAPGTSRPYDLDSTFHEPLVLFSYLAGLTRTIEFSTTIMILSQRQAVLVAKQAACLDVLSNGRFRLGIGTGWNEVEYEALGEDFASRGKRIEEQVEVLRALWTQRAVTFDGQFHKITDAGIYPLPVQQPIPVWFGGGSDRLHFNQPAKLNVLRRIARLGNGWVQQIMPRERIIELNGIMFDLLREYGRDPAEFSIETRFDLSMDPDQWVPNYEGLLDTGLTHIGLNTMGGGLFGVDAHLKRLEEFRQLVLAK